MTNFWQITGRIIQRIALLLFVMVPLCILFSWMLAGMFSPSVVSFVSVILSYLLAKFVLFVLKFEQVQKEVKQELKHDTDENKSQEAP